MSIDSDNQLEKAVKIEMIDKIKKIIKNIEKNNATKDMCWNELKAQLKLEEENI